MAQKKDKLIAEYINTPISVGDTVLVPIKYINPFRINTEEKRPVKVKKIKDGEIVFDIDDYGQKTEGVVAIEEVKKDILYVGANPFIQNIWKKKTHTVNYGIKSIISLLFPETYNNKNLFKGWHINGIPVKETNFNPYVIDKDGNKQYYQRPFVWTLEEKQLLIESIYKGLNCGQIIVRNHGQKELDKRMNYGDTEICFRDVVDGKQRINALYEFMTDKFPDMHGNYYSDLSRMATCEFDSSQAFTFVEMVESTTDEEVIAAFLNVNFTGVPQSKEHIEYVEQIAKNFNRE